MTGELIQVREITPRQHDALEQLALGRSYVEGATELDISERTFSRHAFEAYERLGVRTDGKGSAIAAFVRLGWLDPHARPRAEFHHTPATWTMP